MRWVSVALRVTNTHCFPSCWVECPSVSDPEAVQTRRTCQCTYCKDVYVGLLCLRVIYLHKDHDVTLEISGEIYLKYVAFCLSLWRSLRLRTNTGSFIFFFSFFFLPVQYYRSDPHSQAGAASQQDHKLEAVHTHYTCSSHLEKTLCIWATVDLCCLFTTVDNCWAFYRTDSTYFSNCSVLQNLWNINWRLFFQSAGAWKSENAHKEAALFNKLSHVIPSDRNYLTFVLNNNKSGCVVHYVLAV